MAVNFHPLPLEVFTEEARPFISRLNRELRDIAALEGTIGLSRRNARRSDKSITRNQDIVIDSSVINPPVAKNETFITINNESNLTNERKLAVDVPITKADTGANGSLTIGLDVATLNATLDHGLLDGLDTAADDDHPQYVRINPTADSRNVINPTGTNDVGIDIRGQNDC